MNDFDGLLKTLQSLKLILGGDNVQWIVVDGGSERQDDNILDIVKSLADKVISETDEGIYDAMNKGVKFACGDFVLFLNAGDRIHHNFELNQIITAGQHYPDMIWGSYDESGKNNQISNIQPKSARWLWWGMPTSHQSILFRRESLGNEPYDESLRIAGDYDLVLKLMKEGASLALTSLPICVADFTGISNTKKRLALSEQMLVRNRYYGTSFILNWLVSMGHVTIGWIGNVGFLRRLWKRGLL